MSILATIKKYKGGVIIACLSFVLVLVILYISVRKDTSYEGGKSDQRVEELQKQLEKIKKKNVELTVERDSLISNYELILDSVKQSKSKTVQIIKIRDEKNTSIRRMLDGDLLKFFSNIDSLNRRSRR